MIKFFRMARLLKIAILVMCGVILVHSALVVRDGFGPEAAPEEVQATGMSVLQEQLVKIRSTEFGKSERGRLLFDRVEKIMDQKKIIFTSEILGGENALCKCDFIGGEKWYIEVKRNEEGTFTHLPPHQLIEVAFHEALHSVKGGYGGKASIEEECDAFVAGHQAEAAVQGIEPQQVVILEDVPVAKFVARSYVGIEHNSQYEPVAESFDWLKKRSGL
jgi:hypothetical protein